MSLYLEKPRAYTSEILDYSIFVSHLLSFIKCLMSSLGMVHHLYMFSWRTSIRYIIPIKCGPGIGKEKRSLLFLML